METKELAWNLFCQLREEILENQRTRNSIRQTQFAFISTIIGGAIIAFFKFSIDLGTESTVTNNIIFNLILYLVLATIYIFSVSLDLASTSYEISTNRIGRYLRDEIEKKVFLDSGFLMWETYINDNAIYLEPFNVYSAVQRVFNSFLYSFCVYVSSEIFNSYSTIITSTSISTAIYPRDILLISSALTFFLFFADWVSFAYSILFSRRYIENIKLLVQLLIQNISNNTGNQTGSTD